MRIPLDLHPHRQVVVQPQRKTPVQQLLVRLLPLSHHRLVEDVCDVCLEVEELRVVVVFYNSLLHLFHLLLDMGLLPRVVAQV
mmetsp:Transcript_21426/g.20597  ORF Transcript_21426/g.20597 Transcript_21426/m.20597 type:complete len:83 (+) Transcript_21426:1469-1717(+)